MSILSKTKRIADAVIFNLRVHGLADRRYLTDTMLPQMALKRPSNVMLAGTRRYNARYPKYFEPQTTSVWTLDLDPQAARWGNGKFHRTCDIRELASVFCDVKFDVVHINGLLGFGVDEKPVIKQMVDAVHSVLISGGYMMLGWDADVTEDPVKNPDITAKFQHEPYASLPARDSVVRVSGHAHVFHWFRRLS